MSAAAHAVSIIVAIALAYLWLQVPILRDHSLQIFAVMMIIFFIIKRLRKAKIWHIAPEPGSLELTIITFSFLLLIGATGNTNSIFFPLGFLHLFFIVLAATVPVAIVATVGIMLFHYAVEPGLGIDQLQALTALPIMLILFIFTKHQYDQAKFGQTLLKEEKQVIDSLSSQEKEFEAFITEFLQPKLAALRQLAANLPAGDQFTKILQSIETELAKLIKKTNQPKHKTDEK